MNRNGGTGFSRTETDYSVLVPAAASSLKITVQTHTDSPMYGDTDNGYLVLKFFMQIDKKEQTRRIEKLNKEQDTKWRVDTFDKWQNEQYSHCQKDFDR